MFWSCRSAVLIWTHAFCSALIHICLKLMITTWGINNTVFPHVKVVFVSVQHTELFHQYFSYLCTSLFANTVRGQKHLFCLKRSDLQGSFTHGQTWSGSCSHLLTVGSVHYQFITRTQMDITNSGDLCMFIQHFNTTVLFIGVTKK